MKRVGLWFIGAALALAVVVAAIYLHPSMPCDPHAVVLKGTNADCRAP